MRDLINHGISGCRAICTRLPLIDYL
jgi:hypothetical protein